MSRDVRLLADGFSLLEGPRWRDGRLYASDFHTHRVLAFAPDGSYETIAEVPQQPSGLGWDTEGRLLIVSMLDRQLLRLEHDGSLGVAADLSTICPTPTNDMVVDAQGRAYIGDFGSPAGLAPTNIVRVDPDGTVAIAAKDVICPNGSCITPDGRTFLLAETFASRISAFDIEDDGSLANKRDWAVFAEPRELRDLEEAVAVLPVLPDGMCLDAEGCLWVGCAKGDGAYRVREGGEIVDKVETGGRSVFATMLGGEDRRTLYLCCAPPVLAVDQTTSTESCLMACEVEVPGAGLP
jgi:sugar lactone lactonase YvrE